MITDLVLISGTQGSGKTTLVNNIHDRILELGKHETSESNRWGVVKLNFADALYEMHDACRSILKKYDVDPPHKVKDGNLLQLLGTEWGRNTIHPDIWVEILANRVEQAVEVYDDGKHNRLTILVGDCRFKNELFSFPEAFSIRLECPEEVRRSRVSMWRENKNHISEVDLDDCLESFDLVLDTEKFSESKACDIAIRTILRKSMGQDCINPVRQ